MDSFLSQVARVLYTKYGDSVSSLDVVFPSNRARLFFADSLSGIIDKPIWQPNYTSIDEIMEEIAGIVSGDRIRLVAELYKTYSKFHRESFDSFFFWGETLLSDFDSIDKYLIDAEMLFTNISDLKTLENSFDYLTEDQRQIVSRFWKSFGDHNSYSDEQLRFITVWNTLFQIYSQYKTSLTDLGIAYPGMVYRTAAEKIAAGQPPDSMRKHYVIAGFNALSKCEKALFDHLASVHDVDFFWDYDHYYLDSPEQEAGLFLRDNVRRYPQRISLPHDYRSFSGEKKITVISAVSDSMQCKYIETYISEIEQDAGRKPDKETAIVLTDEHLLMPALYSIPSSVDKINVTMGYPLKLTLEYSFVERLIGLYAHSKVRNNKVLYHHEDLGGILTHPYVIEKCGSFARTLATDISERQQVYIDISGQGMPGLLGDIFSVAAPGTAGWGEFAQYLKLVVSQVFPADKPGDTNTPDEMSEVSEVSGVSDTMRKQRMEFLTLIINNIDKLSNSLEQCGIELSVKMFASLLRRVLQSVRLSYEGEPLQGVQVMGILETRNIDFENVLILSANDDNFPGNMSNSASFIPYNLRVAYGLPTPQHHEGVYAYYFYRLLQRAKNVHLGYSSHSDEKSSGEQSRYIYQLEYESPHSIVRREMAISVNVGESPVITVDKGNGLDAFLKPDGRRLSPTALYRYIMCPLQFYFYSIARIEPGKTVSEDIDMPMFGTILHKAMELIYRPLVGDEHAPEAIRKLIGMPGVADAVDAAIRKEYFKNTEATDYSGNLLYVRDIIIKYIDACILPYDAGLPEFRIVELEGEVGVGSPFEFSDSEGILRTVRLRGYADRIDRLTDGTYRIVDYKTGRENLDFKGVESLFSGDANEYNSSQFQAMTYAMLFNRDSGSDVRPALYFVRNLNSPDYSDMLCDKIAQTPVKSYIAYKQRFEGLLAETLSQLFDLRVPFIQCRDRRTCERCDFNVICKR